jgi:hypothetical protein
MKQSIIKASIMFAGVVFLTACTGQSGKTSPIENKYMSSQGWNKLSVAVHRGDLVKVKSLVLMGEDINHEGSFGDTPLSLAIEKRHKLIIKFLLKNGAAGSQLEASFLRRYDKLGEISQLIEKYQVRADFQQQPPVVIQSVITSNEVNLVASSTGGPRTALVIGNSNYSFGPLKNPVNDARDMSRVLKLAGFDVTMVVDASREKIDTAVNQFSQKLGGGVALFYYAGHAVQVDGHNYIIPIGEDIDSQAKVKYRGVDIDQVLSEMGEARSGLNIVVLDACRDNPLPKESRSASRGLVRVKSPSGTLIAFSTSPGETASDGVGRNGTYTKYLLHYMKVADLPIESVLKGVSRSVKKATNNKQQPWVETSFDGEFSFFVK